VIANTAGAVIGAVLWRAVLLVGRRVLPGRRLELVAPGANTRTSTSTNMRTTSSPQEVVLVTAGPSRRRPHPSEPRTPAREGARGS
jgi:hypothetical protein